MGALVAFVSGLALGLLAAAACFAMWRRADREAVEHRVRNGSLEAELAAARALLEARSADDVRARDAFKALAGDILGEKAEALTASARGVVAPLEQALRDLDAQVRGLESKREAAYADVGGKLAELNRAHVQLQQTTVTLSQALKSSAVRGRWGEIQLQRVVELSGMTEHVGFSRQVAGEAGRPDLVIHLPMGGELPVDAKAPMDAYLDAMGLEEEGPRKARLAEHAEAMRTQIRLLGDKAYWKQFDRAPEFVVMFVPLEPALGAAFEAKPDLLDFALERRVMIATPVTLLALLKATAWGWQQQRVTDNIRKIEELCRDFYDRLVPFLGNFVDAGKKLDAAVKAYNETVGSVTARVLPAARRLKELGAGTDALPEPVEIERRARSLDAGN